MIFQVCGGPFLMVGAIRCKNVAQYLDAKRCRDNNEQNMSICPKMLCATKKIQFSKTNMVYLFRNNNKRLYHQNLKW